MIPYKKGVLRQKSGEEGSEWGALNEGPQQMAGLRAPRQGKNPRVPATPGAGGPGRTLCLLAAPTGRLELPSRRRVLDSCLCLGGCPQACYKHLPQLHQAFPGVGTPLSVR